MFIQTVFLTFTACSAAQSCTTQSQPNPIAQQGNAISGTINGTVSILPVSYELARSIVPSEYPILQEQYHQWLPALETDMYPVMLQTELDHDIYAYSIATNSDFLRASIYFPYVDRLNDGYTAMAYSQQIFISANASPIVDVATALYGYTVTPGNFDPPCDGYAYTGNGDDVYVTVYDASLLANTTEAALDVTFTPSSGSSLRLDFWQNITNQPTFSRNPLFCDNYVRLLNTSVSEPPYSPVSVEGNVTLLGPYFFNETMSFTGVTGIKLDQAFIENNYVSCESLKGYSVVNAPAS